MPIITEINRPTTEAAGRLTSQIVALTDAISRIEQRPNLTVGQGDPTGVAPAGFLWIDGVNGHLWVSAGDGGWVTADMQRAYNVDPGTYCTTGTTGDFAGPNVTLYVPPNGYIGVFMDADLQASAGGASASMWLYDGVDIPGSFLTLQSSQTAFEHRVTVSSSSFGTNPPYGEWIVFPATPGIHTIQPRYVSAVGGQQVCFRNRKLWVVTF